MGTDNGSCAAECLFLFHFKSEIAVAHVKKSAVDKRVGAAVVFLWGLWMLWVFGSTAWSYFTTEVDGTIISAQDIPYRGAPRYSTKYIIRASDGQNTNYVSGPNDGFLPRSMPVGTTLLKQSGEMSYERNGQRIIEFPVKSYLITVATALAMIIMAFALFLSKS